MENDLQKVKDLLKVRGCSDRTVSNYLSCINRFKNHFNNKDITSFTEENILDYLKNNFIDLGMSAATINVNRAAIKYYYLVNFNIDFSKTLLPSCKVKNRFPILITKKQIIDIFNNESNLKHKLWLILAFGSGLRVSEIATLKVSNILSKEHKIKVIGKGNKERFVPLPDFTLKLLRLYWIKNKNKIKTDYLFPGVKNSKPHIGTYSIKKAFQKMKQNNKLDNSITLHTLRHSFATEYIKAGGDIWELKSLLGHASINSTMVYLHMAKNFKEVSSPLDKVCL